MENMHLKMCSCNERELSVDERIYLDRLFSINFKDKDILSYQIKTSKVIGYCNCGCKSILLKVDRELPSFQHNLRVPVEMIVECIDEIPIVMILHVLEGFIDELEIFRADSTSINEPIIISESNTKVIVNEILKLD